MVWLFEVLIYFSDPKGKWLNFFKIEKIEGLKSVK